MQKKFLIANVLFLTIIIALIEAISFIAIKGNLGEFDLKTQGGTTMLKSYYQVWEHPAEYKSWSKKTEFNNLAFRRRDDLTIEKPDGTTRIFIMGGSAAFGSQAMPGSIYLQLSGQGEYKNEETISYYLEQLLSEKYPNKTFEVINAATNWSRLHQQMIHYLRKLRVMEPDLILSMDAYNDSSIIRWNNSWLDTQRISGEQLFNNFKHKLTPVFQNSYTAYLMAMIIFKTGQAFAPDQEQIQHFSAIKAPKNLQELLNKSEINDAEQINTNVSEYLSNLKYFDAILDQDNVKHIFYLQPLTILDKTKPLTAIEQAIQGYQWDNFDTGQQIRIHFFNRVAEEAAKLEAQGILDFESMLNIFAGVEEEVYSDYCHFTPHGNKLIAQYFLKEIETKHPELLQ